MQTFASTADPAASHWPADGSRLDRLDKRLSGPLFQLQLGARLEVLLSVPGCFFGMPAALAVTPSLLAAAYSGGVPPSHLALGAGVLLLAAWGVVVIGESERLALALSLRAEKKRLLSELEKRLDQRAARSRKAGKVVK